jgi:Flp pilus assembly protein TadG
MRRSFPKPSGARAQTLVFFTLAIGTICLLCGLAIDSGLLFLAKARLSRAVDGAALAAVGNFSQGNTQVATIMRNFAVANFTDLGGGSNGGISTTATVVTSTYTLTNGETGTTYTYNFNDGTTDANGQFKRYVEVVLKTGSGGQITSATCNARCPVTTYFMGIAGSFFRDLKVSSSAVATRNPRLIMVVVDRSASMLQAGGGAFGLPNAIVTFLNFFDTTSDYIGIVSFSSNARLEVPLTTNFLYAATNNLTGSYDTNTDLSGYPRADPEQTTDPNYFTSGVRRLKFGGSTCAEEGIRMGLEQLMANPGFNNPDVVKYMVIFTDGAWNCARTLLAAPGYTNTVTYPTAAQLAGNVLVSALSTDPQYESPNSYLPMPTMSPMPDESNALNDPGTTGPSGLFHYEHHTNDVFQSIDGSVYEPLPRSASPSTTVVGFTTNVVRTTYLGTATGTQSKYTKTVDVWLQPGAVDYVYSNNIQTAVYVSDYTNPTQEVKIDVPVNGSNVLVVPGYIIDGTFTDSIDLPYPDDYYHGYDCYRIDNALAPYMWPDDGSSPGNPSTIATASTSNMRRLIFRNYINLLTGYYVYRADDPPSVPATIEPLNDTTDVRPLHGLGPYYPSAGFYYPFSLVGTDFDETFCLANALYDPSGTNDPHARFISWSVNMLSPEAAPNWTGELFYHGTNSALSTGTTAASFTMSSETDWKSGAPTWLTSAFRDSECMTSDAVHNSNLTVKVWRPSSFNGASNAMVGPIAGGTGSITQSDSLNHTGGYVSDGTNYYRNVMAYSGRPTHYYNFATSSWVPITHNHLWNPGYEAYPMGVWKAKEYAWHARALGVTIYTVGYGLYVSDPENVLLAQVANATNVNLLTGPPTNISFIAQQPIGQQFYATNSTQISNDFYQIGQAINEALTQ